ncbi:MAG: PAS domain S-box protein [Kiritimatiellia bacterium]
MDYHSRTKEQLIANLREWGSFERVVSAIAGRFVSAAAGNIDEAIENSLRDLGEFQEVDRAYIYAFSGDSDGLRVVNDWARDGVEPKKRDLESIDPASFPWFRKKVKHSEIVHVPDVASLPTEAEAIKEELQSEDVQSALMVPLLCSGRLIGFAGFDSVWNLRTWSETSLSFLTLVSEIFASALERKRTEEELLFRTEIEELVASISARFVNIDADKVDEAVNTALRDLGEFMDVDRCYIYRLYNGGRKAEHTHGWDARLLDSVAQERNVVSYRKAPWGFKRLYKGKSVVINNPESLPKKALADREHMKSHGVQSIIGIPFSCGRRDHRFLGFSCQTEPREWTEDTVAVLKMAARIFATAFERKKAFAELEKERGLFSSLMSNIPDRIYFKDVNSRFVRINDEMAKSFGLKTPEQAVGKTDFDFFSKEHAEQAFKDEEEVITSGRPIVGKEEKETWPDGSETWVSTTKLPLFQNGKIRGTFGISRDITGWRKAQNDLIKEREHLRTLIDNLPGTFVFIKDSDSRFVTTNAAHLAILGCDKLEDVEGKTDFDFFVSEIADGYFKDEQNIIATGKPLLNKEERTVDKDGSEKILLTSKVPLYEHEGTVRGILGISTDITALKQAERERRKIEQGMLHTQKLESLGVLSGGIAHDFNNLLMGIMGNVGVAMNTLGTDSPAWDSLKQIETTALRAAELTNQMLAYCGKSKVVIKPVHLTSLVKEMGHLLSVTISENATITYDLSEDLPMIEADVSQVRQVVMNLITNASDAMGSDGGSITVKTGIQKCDSDYLAGCYIGKELPEGEYVFVEVSDTGCGMDPAVVEKIFDPFFTTKVSGRGLGLASVLGIMSAHHGAMTVYSEPGRGTDFKLMFPASGKPSARKDTEETAALDQYRGARMLVVDDDGVVRTVTDQLLETLGVSAVNAADAETALKLYEESHKEIKAALVDVNLPSGSAAELIAKMREINGRLPVVLISGYSEPVAMESMNGTAYQGFLQKPFTADSLRAAMSKALAGGNAARQ